MSKNPTSGTSLHKTPLEIKKFITLKKDLSRKWESLTPLARNEWICWVTSAKKEETKSHRLKRMQEELNEGKRRPCCWAGCPHRQKNG